MQQGLAVVTAGDATFKFIKSERLSGSEKGVSSKAESLYSILNERNEVFNHMLMYKVILAAPLLNDNLRDLKDAILHMFVKRFHGRGAPPPRLCYSDLCCEDRAIMAEIMEEFYCLTGQKCIVENAAIELFDDEALPLLEFPRGLEGHEILPHVVSKRCGCLALEHETERNQVS